MGMDLGFYGLLMEHLDSPSSLQPALRPLGQGEQEGMTRCGRGQRPSPWMEQGHSLVPCISLGDGTWSG